MIGERYKFKPYDKLIIAIITILAISLVALKFSNGISGNDFWWHIKAGEWMVDNMQIPTSDIFSWHREYMDMPWVAHEWLSEIIFYIIYKYSGAIGVLIFCFIVAMILIGLVVKEGFVDISRSPVLSIVLIAMFIGLISVYIYGRPYIFSYFFILAELKILYRFYKNNDTKSIYLIPVISIAWSNLHGGSSSLVYVICLVFLIIGCINFRVGRVVGERLSKNALIKLGGITIASIIALMINPIGFEVLLYPFKCFGDPIQMSMIAEWQAPNAKNIFELITCFMPVCLVIFSMMQTDKEIRLIDIAILALFSLMFIRSVRFCIPWNIAVIYCGFRYIPTSKIRLKVTRKADIDKVKNNERVYIIACGILMVATLVISGINFNKTISNGQIISTVLSDEVIEVIKEDNPERIFNDYNYGVVLVYNDIPVFVDARADLYVENGILGDSFGLSLLDWSFIEGGETSVEELIEKYNFDAMLTSSKSALCRYIESHQERFSIIYKDDDIIYCRLIEEGTKLL